MFGVHGADAEVLHVVPGHQLGQGLVVADLDLLDLVGGAEAVEEVQEGDLGAQGGDVADQGQIVDLLHRASGDQAPPGVAAAHHIGVVAEDRQGVSRHGARGDVDHAGAELTRDLVHVGDHQQQALGGGEGHSECTAGERAMDSTGRAGLGLHLHHAQLLAEDVGAPLGRPLVRHLAHAGRGCDRIDRGDIGKGVTDVRRCGVTVDGDELLAHYACLLQASHTSAEGQDGRCPWMCSLLRGRRQAPAAGTLTAPLGTVKAPWRSR